MKNYLLIIIHMSALFTISLTQNCEMGYTEFNNLCFHDGDIEVLQKMINNSINSGVGDDCDPYDSYCGSPNPYMDQEDAWFWIIVDGIYYQSGTGNGFQNSNGQVDPLELGIQEWEDGRLTSIMCGAYIYCQLSGPIPEEINNLSELSVLRLEYNYLSGFIPETICDLNTNNIDYLEFDLTGNSLCPPYPECIGTSNFWSQDTSSCSDIGDINYDSVINILDVIILISFILEGNYIDYQNLILSDINLDGNLDILDIVEIVNIIINSGSQLQEECYIVPEIGDCDGICPTYFYNQNTNQCEEFITGCCGVEAFDNLQECQNICE